MLSSCNIGAYTLVPFIFILTCRSDLAMYVEEEEEGEEEEEEEEEEEGEEEGVMMAEIGWKEDGEARVQAEDSGVGQGS